MKVTIGVPVLNGEAYLERAIESIQNQTFGGELSIVIADNGSTDGTATIAQELASRDPPHRLSPE